jgi:hypothetical protein
MVSLLISIALTASPSLPSVPQHEIQLVPAATPAPAPSPVPEAQSPWTGERGRHRIIGLSLIGGAGVLTLTALALFVSAASVSAYQYPAGYCDPRFGACYGYPYAYAPSPWPYLLAGIAVLAGAGTAAGFGIPMLLKGFRQD